jgi:signal transduction histidine kinase/ActR/RegA family two-component response regulator
MNHLKEVARLNLVLELVSECAGLADTTAVARAIGARLHWIVDFKRCTLALRTGGELLWCVMESGGAEVPALALAAGPTARSALIEAAMCSGAPMCEGVPMDIVAYPLGEPGQQLGALCVERETAPYTYRDLRLIHHICTSLGAVLTRLSQQELVDTHRRDVRDLAVLAERERSDRADAATDANDAFLAMLGHELRNPLAPILAAAQLLRRQAQGAPIPEVEIIERQTRHLDRLVSDLLDVSRVTTGKVNLQRTTLDLVAVIMKGAEMTRPLMDRKRQTLSLDLPAGPLLVDGDETRLCQVISNLLNNASIYSPAGRQVKLKAEALAGEAVVTVSDEGIGIPVGMLESIFEMFVQGGRSKELAPAGLGLGLGVARSLVELHGGRIRASSAGEGCGSRFTVWLPGLVPGDHVAAPAPWRDGASVDTGVPSRRVLMVDDNMDAANMMGELARAAGHVVEVAYGPEQALLLAESFRPEVAVLDIGLPVMDGYLLALEMRARVGDAPLTLIALSGYGQERDRERSRAHGFTAHLVKPAEVSELLDLIARAGFQALVA